MQTPDLSRFLEAHDADYATALHEVQHGRKETHWMWYIFPEVTGLGRSPTARHYEITSVDEAAAFLAHPVLGPDYRRIVAAVRDQVVVGGVSVHELFGSPDDAKLVSSLTLFVEVARRASGDGGDADPFVAAADEVLGAAYAQGLARCATTEAFLAG